MRFYRYLNVSFLYENKEYELFPEEIDEDDFEVTVVTKARHPNLKRGCVGNLIYTCCGGTNVRTGEDVDGDFDCLNNMLLKKIQVWDTDENGVPTWKYVFDKE